MFVRLENNIVPSEFGGDIAFVKILSVYPKHTVGYGSVLINVSMVGFMRFAHGLDVAIVSLGKPTHALMNNNIMNYKISKTI